MAAKAQKVTISLDGDLLARAERLRRATGESRSRLLGRALRRLLRAEQHTAQVREYGEAYRRMPESPQEVVAARALAARALEGLPWEEP